MIKITVRETGVFWYWNFPDIEWLKDHLKGRKRLRYYKIEEVTNVN